MATTVGICGGSGAGKTTLAVHVIEQVGTERVSLLAFDAYYRDLSHISMEERRQVNYDHPDSLDQELFIDHLEDLRSGNCIEVPEYDFATHTRTGRSTPVEAREIVLVEGILLFSLDGIHELLDIAVFLDVPEPVRLERRVRRDVVERGRDPDDVRRQFASTVVPMHDEFVQPYRDRAHRVVDVDEQLHDVADELASHVTNLADTTA